MFSCLGKQPKEKSIQAEAFLHLKYERDSQQTQIRSLRQQLEVALLRAEESSKDAHMQANGRAEAEHLCDVRTQALMQLLPELNGLIEGLGCAHFLDVPSSASGVVAHIRHVDVTCHEEQDIAGNVPHSTQAIGASTRSSAQDITLTSPRKLLQVDNAPSSARQADQNTEDQFEDRDSHLGDMPLEARVGRTLHRLRQKQGTVVEGAARLWSALQENQKVCAELQAQVVSVKALKQQAETKARVQLEALQAQCGMWEESTGSLKDLTTELATQAETGQATLDKALQDKRDAQKLASRAQKDAHETAEKVDRAQTELQALQSAMHALQQEQTRSLQESRVLQTRCDAGDQETIQLRQAVEEQGAARVALEEKLSALQAELATTSAAAQAAQDAAASSQALVMVEQARFVVEQARAGQLADKVVTEQTRAGQLAEQLQAAEVAMATLRQQADSHALLLVEVRGRNTRLQAELDDLQEQLAQAEVAVSEAERAAATANASLVGAKREVVEVKMRLAGMAGEQSKALVQLGGSGDLLDVRTQELQGACAALEAARAEVAAADARATALVARVSETDGELGRTRAERDTAASAATVFRGVLQGVASLSVRPSTIKGVVVDSGEDEEALAGYEQTVQREQSLRLQLDAVPMAVLDRVAGALAGGGAAVQHLHLGIDLAKCPSWEDIALRAACLSAALATAGAGGGLRELSLAAWSWSGDGAGIGLAGPFLSLACSSVLSSARGSVGPTSQAPGSIVRTAAPASAVASSYSSLMPSMPSWDRDSSAGYGQVPSGLAPGVRMQHLQRLKVDTQLMGPACVALLAQLLHQGLVTPKLPDGRGVLELCTDHANISSWYQGVMQGVMASQAPPQAGRASSTKLGGSVSVPMQGSNSFNPSVNGSPGPSRAASSIMSRATGASVGASMAPAPTSLDCILDNEGLACHHMVLVMVGLILCPTLQRVRLAGNKVGAAGAKALALGVAGRTTLLELGLARNQIDSDGLKKLAVAVATSSIRDLDVARQRVSAGGSGPSGRGEAEGLCFALASSITLQRLAMGSVALTEQGVTMLCKLMVHNNSLRRLELQGCCQALSPAALRMLQAAAESRGITLSL